MSFFTLWGEEKINLKTGMKYDKTVNLNTFQNTGIIKYFSELHTFCIKHF